MLTVVKYQADWCAACKALEPALNKLEDDGLIDVIYVNVETDAAQAVKANVRSLPTLIVYRKMYDDGVEYMDELGRGSTIDVVNNLLES